MMKIKKIVFLLIISSLLITPIIVNADSNLQNIAPTVNLAAQKRKPVDVIVVTDYSGQDYVNMQNSLASLKASTVATANIQTTILNDSSLPLINIGSQYGQYTKTTYAVQASYYFVWSGQWHDVNQSNQTATNMPESGAFNLNSVDLNPGETPPSGFQPSPTGYYATSGSSNGPYGGGSWYTYHFNGYTGTYQFDLQYCYINGQGGSTVLNRNSWTLPTFTYTNNWAAIYSNQYSCTNTVKAYDLSGIPSLSVQPNSDVYVIFALNNSSTDYYSSSVYNPNCVNNYKLGNLKGSNFGTFIRSTNAHVYSCSGSIDSINLSNSSNNASYTDPAKTQDVSIQDLINNYSTDGRFYTRGQFQSAANAISMQYTNPNSNADVILATDNAASTQTSFISNLTSSINHNVSLKTTVLDNTSKSVISNLQKPNVAMGTKTSSIYTGNGSASIILTPTGDLFAKGDGTSEYNLYNQSYSGLFGNGSGGYSDYTKIMTNCADAQFINGGYRNYTVDSMLIILKKDGTVWASGSNISGLIAPYNGTNNIFTTFTQISGLSNVIKMAYANIGYECAFMSYLTSTGNVYYAGYDELYAYHPTNHSDNGLISGVILDTTISNVVSIACAPIEGYGNMAYGCSDGKIYCRGLTYYANPNIAYSDCWHTATSCEYAYSVPSAIKSINFAENGDGLDIITQTGDLYRTCRYVNNSTGLGNNVTATTPKKLLSNVSHIVYANSQCKIVTTNDGGVYYWGGNCFIPSAILGYTYSNNNVTFYTPVLSTTMSNLDSIVNANAGSIENSMYTIYRKTDGTYYYSGSSQYNQLMTSDSSIVNKSFSTTLAIPYTPDPSLNIVDYFYDSGNGLEGVTSTGQLLYCYVGGNYVGGSYVYSFTSNVIGNIYAACSITPIPVYGISTSAIEAVPLTANSERYFIYVSNSVGHDTTQPYGGTYFPFGNLTDDLLNYLKNNNFNVYIICPSTALNFKLLSPAVPSTVQTRTLQDLLNAAVKDAAAYTSTTPLVSVIANKFTNVQAANSTSSIYLIKNEDTLGYSIKYSDFENDPQYTIGQYYFTQDPNYFESGTGVDSFVNQWVATPPATFSKTGHYTLKCKIPDNPEFDSPLANNFNNYRLWSNVTSTLDIYVHSRPIAEFLCILQKSGANYSISLSDMSYDPDHISRTDKGLAAEKWSYRPSNSTNWTSGMIPSIIAPNSKYDLQLVVQDIEGAWSQPYIKTIDTTSANLPPIVDSPPKAYNFKISMIQDSNWRNYYFDLNNGIDQNGDGVIDMYPRNANTDIFTTQMPVNNYELVSYGVSCVRAGAEIKGSIMVNGSPDSVSFAVIYYENGIAYGDTLTPFNAGGGQYTFDWTVPLQTDQGTFIAFNLDVQKDTKTYGNEIWKDTWASGNSNNLVLYISGGTVQDDIIFQQSN